MIELTQEQQEALDNTAPPVRVVDPRSKQAFVLVPAEQYERMEGLLHPGPLSEEERKAILEGVWRRANWDDARMAEYDSL